VHDAIRWIYIGRFSTTTKRLKLITATGDRVFTNDDNLREVTAHLPRQGGSDGQAIPAHSARKYDYAGWAFPS